MTASNANVCFKYLLSISKMMKGFCTEIKRNNVNWNIKECLFLPDISVNISIYSREYFSESNDCDDNNDYKNIK